MTPRVPTSARARVAIAGSTTVAVAAVAVALTVGHVDGSAGSAGSASTGVASTGTGTGTGTAKPLGARLISSSCGGPAGAAYVSDSGWDGFSAIDTANCKIIQTYNVGDPQVDRKSVV